MLGQRIGELRNAFGWSQVDLAKRLGVAKQTVSNWENENIQPSVEMLVRLAKLFGVTTSTFDGATYNLKGKYTVSEMKAIIDRWKNKEVK